MTNCCHYFWYSFDFATFMQQWIGQTSGEAHISQQNFHPLHVAFSNLDRVHLFLLFTFFFLLAHTLYSGQRSVRLRENYLNFLQVFHQPLNFHKQEFFHCGGSSASRGKKKKTRNLLFRSNWWNYELIKLLKQPFNFGCTSFCHFNHFVNATL